MDEKKMLRRSARVSLVWILVLLLAVAGGTFAWFNFNSSTNIEPYTGSTISSGEGDLLISRTRDGFKEKCNLLPDNQNGELIPISTSDLSSYYKATMQDADGISVLFREATDEVNESTIHGAVYLTCEKGNQDIYFFGPKLLFGVDNQAMSALRLGVKLTSDQNQNSEKHIFNLNSICNPSEAKSARTVSRANSVIKAVKSDGNPVFADDSSEDITDYYASVTGPNDNSPKAGKYKLGTVHGKEIVKVEYWLYLEGCDDHCSNPVRNREVDFALGFAGVPTV